MADSNSMNAASASEVIEEEAIAEEASEDNTDEKTRIEEVNTEVMAVNKKEESSKIRKMRTSKKGKTVKLIPKEHACQPARLPILEVILYVVGWTAAALYSLYAVFELSTARGDRLHKDTMGPGWSIIGRKQDVSNFEWTFWSGWFQKTWPWLVAHIIISQLLHKWNNKHRKYIYLVFHAVAVFSILGIRPALFVVFNCLLIYVAAWFGSVILVWIVSAGFVAFLNYDPYTAENDYGIHPLKAMTDFNEDVFYLLVFSIAMTNLRYTSFGLDWVSAQKRAKLGEVENRKDKDKSLTTQTKSYDTNAGADTKKSDDVTAENSLTNKIPVINEPEAESNPDERAINSDTNRSEKDSSATDKDDKKSKESCENDSESINRNMSSAKQFQETSNDKTSKSEITDVKEVKYSLIDMLSYCLYLPYYFTGPHTTYDEFYKQFHAPVRERSKDDWRDILTSTVRVVFWAMFIEVILHYFYFSSIMLHLRLMWHIPLWALAGIGYGAGQFFMVKYVVMFGLPGTVGKLDQLQPPQPPRCIAYIYKYSEMWKYFDRGLYSFLKRHIYIPLGGSKKGVGRQLIASAVCFAFIFWWHGAQWNLFYWSLVNFVGIFLETGGKLFAEIPRVVQWEALWLSPAMGRRIRALLGVPLLAMSSIAIFTFFGGNQVGYIFLRRLLYEGAPTSVLIICAAFYCFCQTSMEIERWRRRKAERIAESKQKLKVQ